MMLPRVAIGILALLLAGAAPAAAQYRGVRFEIASVGDTTVAFRSAGMRWIRDGARGIAVDPRQRDALIARLKVLAIDSGIVTALVTGQTTALTTDHVVVMEEPRRQWFLSRSFWGGLVTGAALGVAVASQM